MGRPSQNEVHLESSNGNIENSSSCIWWFQEGSERYWIRWIPDSKRVASKWNPHIGCFFSAIYLFLLLNSLSTILELRTLHETFRYSGFRQWPKWTLAFSQNHQNLFQVDLKTKHRFHPTVLLHSEEVLEYVQDMSLQESKPLSQFTTS